MLLLVTSGRSTGSRRIARLAVTYRKATALQRQLERRLERRYPSLYDARHALSGIGRALWPLIGPLLAMLIVLPVVLLLAWLWDLLGLQAPSVDVPSVDLPDIAFPSIAVPGWLRAIADIVGAGLSLLGAVAKYVVLAGAAIFGVRRTQAVRRQRKAAEKLGRTELARRMAVALAVIEAHARAHDASVVGDASLDHSEPE
ncbi:MAG: hypothetical protein M3N47_12610 [Chloroflexota bacterium]|nr:hypothetical protein [Chloroflexota bacterium]